MSAKTKKILIVLLVLAATARIGAGFWVRSSFLTRGNSHTPMNQLAKNLIEEGEYSLKKGVPSVDYEPLYPFLMSLGYRLSGYNWIGITLLQLLLVLGTACLIMLTGIHMGSELSGISACAYYLFYPYLFTYSLSIYDTTLFVFIVVFLNFIVIAGKLSLADYIFFGMLAGFGILTRGSVFAILPPLGIGLLYRSLQKYNLKQAVAYITISLLIMTAVIAPWIIRNYSLTEKILISTHGPFGLWQGNNVHSYRLLKDNVSLDEIYRMKPLPEIYQKYPIQPREPKEAVRVADEYGKAAVNFIMQNPKIFFKAALVKFVKFWSWKRNPTSSRPVFGSNSNRQFVYFASYFPLLLLAIIGAVMMIKKRKFELFLIVGILGFYTLAHMIAMGFTRTRIPLDPLLMLPASHAIYILGKKILKIGKRAH